MRRRGPGAGPNLLATIVFENYDAHQPLNRQRERYARESVDLSLSTPADQMGRARWRCQARAIGAGGLRWKVTIVTGLEA